MDRPASPFAGDPGTGGTAIRRFPLPLGGEASLGFSECFFLRFGGCGEAGAFLSEGFGEVWGSA